jgi:DNA-binding MarR family transcriptional regulator
MTTVPTARLRELSLSLREVAWTIHRRAPERAGVGPIPTTELALLKQVLTTPGVTVGQLAAALGLRQPNVSSAVRVLVDKGLVTKVSSRDDRRVVRIHPTELGRTEHEAIAAAWTRPLEQAIASLSPEHQRALESAGEAIGALQAALTGDEGLFLER